MINSQFFKHQMIINVCAQKKLQYLPASLNTLWVIIILTNRLSLLLLFVSKLISISVEIPFGTFLNLVSKIFQRKKIRKLVHREWRTLPNKPFIVGYDATEFVTCPRWWPSWQPHLEPISRQKVGFILAAIVSEFDLKRPNDSEDFQKYFIELT